MTRIRRALLSTVHISGLALLGGAGCGTVFPPPPDDGSGSGFNNTTDPTNGGATYLGSAACRACHSDVAAVQSVHGHAHILNRVQGLPPAYPSVATRAGVPDPPGGFTWMDISYVIGGYITKAKFTDQDGFILTGGSASPLTQWNLSFPPNGATPGFVSYEPATEATHKPYDYACFACHTTGAVPQDPANPRFQENRPGFVGTWQEAGVQCEACHGPGSSHPSNPAARTMYVNTSARACGRCHGRPFDSDGGIIQAQDGFIDHHAQYPELLASGAHAGFDCVTCHNPHASAVYDPANGIRNVCTVCHSDQNMAVHEGKVFVRGDYQEVLTCTSCHMPFATKSATGLLIGQSAGRVADVRTHIFRINTAPVDYTAMFAADLRSVAKDAAGRAAVTLDFVCLRCHNTIGADPFRLTLESAGQIAPGVHGIR